MFKLFSRKSKIKELEAKLDALTQSINFYSKKYCELKEVSINQHHELQHLTKEVQKLQALSKNIIGTQRTEKAADLVSNIVPTKPSAPAVQIKKVKKVKTK
jgi:DNA repair ATPase RecN